jgi:hypothetical protein
MHSEPGPRQDSARPSRPRPPGPAPRFVIPAPANRNDAPLWIRLARAAILLACVALAAWLLLA